MTVAILPDRERRHLLQFYVLPRLSYRRRMVLAFLFIVGGLAVQTITRPDNIPAVLTVSLPLLLWGNLLILPRGYDTTPKIGSGARVWEKTTRDRFLAAIELDEKSRTWDEALLDITCKAGSVFFFLAAAFSLFVFVNLKANPQAGYWAPVFAGDVLVLLVPYWLTGTRRGWRPVRLRQEIETLEEVLGVLGGYRDPPCQVQCLFEMAGEGKDRIPVGARLFVRFPEAPDSFLGIQFQVALNEVQGTRYPYLYAVIVAKKEFGLLKKPLEAVRSQVQPPLVVETEREADVDVIVIRQKTTRNSGYHTRPKTIRRIAHSTWQAVKGFLFPVSSI